MDMRACPNRSANWTQSCEQKGVSARGVEKDNSVIQLTGVFSVRNGALIFSACAAMYYVQFDAVTNRGCTMFKIVQAFVSDWWNMLKLHDDFLHLSPMFSSPLVETPFEFDFSRQAGTFGVAFGQLQGLCWLCRTLPAQSGGGSFVK